MGGVKVFFWLKNLLNYIQKGISKKLFTEMILDRAFQVSKHHHWRTGIWLQLFGLTYFLVVGDHVVEGVVQLVGTLLDLQLLPVDLVLDVVDPLVELGDVHLAVLKPGLSGLVLALQVVDLLNQLLLPSRAFSADFSSCFMLSPTVSNSSSMPFSLASASSALSTALLSSASWTPSFLLSSSSFCSLSEAILTVALRFLSSSSMVTSLLRQVFSTTLMVLRTLSAALEVMASLVTVAQSCSAAFLSSSSMSMILLVRAETSLSTSLNCFSASSRDSLALVSLSLVSSKPISSCCTFFP